MFAARWCIVGNDGGRKKRRKRRRTGKKTPDTRTACCPMIYGFLSGWDRERELEKPAENTSWKYVDCPIEMINWRATVVPVLKCAEILAARHLQLWGGLIANCNDCEKTVTVNTLFANNYHPPQRHRLNRRINRYQYLRLYIKNNHKMIPYTVFDLISEHALISGHKQKYIYIFLFFIFLF